MRKVGLGLLVALMAAPLFAQLGMELTMSRLTFMQYEPVFACVTIRNDSGKALIFGKDPRLQGFLLFDIRDSAGRPAEKLSNEDIIIDSLVLGPGETKSLVFQISRYYNLRSLGVYRIHAYVSHVMLPNEYRTKDVRFTVDTGAEMWRRDVGVPVFNQTENVDPLVGEQRSYSLRSLTDNSIRYFYLVIESKNKVFGVMRLGEAMARELFKADVDMLSRFHVLLPVTPKIFHYMVFELNGDNSVNKYLRTTDTIPSLVRDPVSGKVMVSGGSDAIPGVDFDDPAAGKLSAEQVMQRTYEDGVAPGTKKNEGLVDLGKSKKNTPAPIEPQAQ